MNQSQTDSAQNRFIAYLNGLARREDRAALAALRRGLGSAPGSAAEMHPYVMRFLPPGWGWRHQCHYIVAALFGLHPDDGGGNMGWTLQQVARQSGSDSIERRFVALLKSHRDDLFDHLRHAAGLARGKAVPINWARLLRDIQHWDDEGGWVQRRWSQGFWGAAEEEQTTETSAKGA